MLSPTERKLPDIIELFPGFEDRSYFQNPETGEFWFHATNVCKVLGFSNPTSALSLHCDDDEKLMEICNGKATWFVSEAGCYGLAMGAKNDVAKAFKRWLKHKVLPKLRSQGLVTARMHDESLADYEARDKFLTTENQRLLSEVKRVTKINKECSELDAKLAFIVQAIVDGVCEQMSQFDLSLMSSKKYKKYKVYFDALHELQEVLEDIMPYNILAHKSELTETLTNENINRLFDTVALKKHDVTWDVNFKDWHDANLSEK